MDELPTILRGRPRRFRETARVTFKLDESTKTLLKNIQSASHTLSMSELLRHSISLLSCLHSAKQAKAVFIIRQLDGSESELFI